MKYRMIGIDLDGTLLDRRGSASPENLAALARARQAGVLVVPCTGRGWRESAGALRHLIADLTAIAAPPAGGASDIPGVGRDWPGVFGCGSSVNDVATGRTLNTVDIDPDLALELVEHLFDLPDSVLVFRDPARAGHDYLVTGHGTLGANTQWWFAATGVTAHYQARVTRDDLHHTLRIGMVGNPGRIAAAAASVAQSFPGRVNVQAFEAVQMPDPAESVHVLEIFAQGVEKWRGLSWIAERRGITQTQIAAIGDEVNDVAMIRAAGCGIAMGNAIPAALQAADHVTLDNTRHGVAHAIDQLLSGNW